MTKEELLDRMNTILEQKGWSLNKLAKESGIPTSTIYNISNRKDVPDLQTMMEIAKALDVSFDYLLGTERNDYAVYIDKEFYEICLEFDKKKKETLKQMAKLISGL